MQASLKSASRYPLCPYCSRSTSRSMTICCERCNTWYHYKCVYNSWDLPLQKRQLAQLDNYYCYPCRRANPTLKILYFSSDNLRLDAWPGAQRKPIGDEDDDDDDEGKPSLIKSSPSAERPLGSDGTSPARTADSCTTAGRHQDAPRAAELKRFSQHWQHSHRHVHRQQLLPRSWWRRYSGTIVFRARPTKRL